MVKSCVLATFFTCALLGCPPGPAPVPVLDADAASTVDASVIDAPMADAPLPSKPDAALDATPAPLPDAAPPVPDAAALDDCALAEAVLVKLACKDSRGQPLAVNKKGVPFATICRDARDAGVNMHPTCIKMKATCKDVLSCSL